MPTREATEFFDRIAKGIVTGTRATVQLINDQIAIDLVKATPVDTGFARANWRPSLNAPIEIPVTNNDKTGEQTIARIQVVGRRYRVGDTIFIRNNAEYITNLNEGSSDQAEEDFVKDAVESGFDTAIAVLKNEGFGLEEGQSIRERFEVIPNG